MGISSYKNNIVDYLLYILFFAAVIPLIILCFYNEPSSDDYSYAVSAFSHSFMDNQIFNYLHWGSRYTATGILITNPMVFGWFGGYKYLSLCMILLFITSAFYMFFEITQKGKTALLLTTFFSFIYIFMLPDIVSAFYWLGGSATYHFANILSLLFIALICRINRNPQIFPKIILFVLTFLIIGCNEISMVYLDVFIFSICLYFYFRYKKINLFYFSLLIWAGLLTLFILLAPGNAVRAGIIENNHNLSHSLIGSVRKVMVMLVRYGIIIFIINFLFFYNLKDYLKTIKLNFLDFPLYFYFVLGLFFLFLGSFPSLWAAGIYPPGRALNVIFFVMLLFSLILNYKLIKSPLFDKLKISRMIMCFGLLAVVLGYTFILKSQSLSGFQNNLYHSYNDLLTCKAQKYQQEMENRYEIIKTSTADTVFVKPINSIPKTIFYKDLNRDPNYFYNQGMSVYFNKKAIIAK